jgi:hypothetical protein
MGYVANNQCVLDRMNRFIGSASIVTTLSYHNFKTAVTIAHKQVNTLQTQ